MIGYVKDGIRLLEEHRYSSDKFEAIYMCVHKQTLLQPLQIVGIYVSPQNTYNHFIQVFENFMQQIDTLSCPTIIIGDFNMKSVTKQDKNYNKKFEDHMKSNYNMTQFIQEPTHDKDSVLDLCFSTVQIDTSLIWNHWSDHSIIAISIKI